MLPSEYNEDKQYPMLFKCRMAEIFHIRTINLRVNKALFYTRNLSVMLVRSIWSTNNVT